MSGCDRFPLGGEGESGATEYEADEFLVFELSAFMLVDTLLFVASNFNSFTLASDLTKSLCSVFQ